MTRSFALVAGAFAATVAFSGASFAQSRPSDATLDSYVSPQAPIATPVLGQRSANDLRQQRLNDIHQRTSDAGRPFIASNPVARNVTLTPRDRALEEAYEAQDSTSDFSAFYND